MSDRWCARKCRLAVFWKAASGKIALRGFATTSSSTILDQHDYEGDILYLIEEAQKYVLKNIHIGMELDGLYRVDVPEISQAAFREAIINAFYHRDYRDPDEVRVAIYKDRVEIRNPSSLYGGLTIDDLRKGHVSKRRNPLVAQMLGRIHMVESWGRGMPLILENEPTVEFKEIAEIFITVFRRKSFQEAENINSGRDADTDTKTTIITTTNTTTKTTTINLPSTLNPASTTSQIFLCIAANPNISLDELAAEFGLTKDGAYYHTTKLRKMGLLYREGTKGGKWIINFQS